MSLRSKPLELADELRLLCFLGNRCLLFMLLRDKPLEDLAPPESYLALDAGGSARGAAQKKPNLTADNTDDADLHGSKRRPSMFGGRRPAPLLFRAADDPDSLGQPYGAAEPIPRPRGNFMKLVAVRRLALGMAYRGGGR